MKRINFSRGACAAGWLILALTARGGEPLTPVPEATAGPAPATQALSGGFVRYIPNREGDFEWKIEGESVSFLSPVCLEITRLTAAALVSRLEGLTIEAGMMTYFTDSGLARGDGSWVTVRRENMVLNGRGYLWTPLNRQIRIFEDVRFLIKEGGGGGLFPL